MIDPDAFMVKMQEAQCPKDDDSDIDSTPIKPVANARHEDMLDAVHLEAGKDEPNDREASPPTIVTLPVLADGEIGGATDADGSGSIIEDLRETLLPKQPDEAEEPIVNKITWPLIGRVTNPGRYMYRFGWLTVSAADLAIWQAYPNAAFTLIRTYEMTGEEFRLGTFELRIDSNYSQSEK